MSVGGEPQHTALEPSTLASDEASGLSHLSQGSRSGSPPPVFSYETQLAGFTFRIEQEGKHTNLHVEYVEEDEIIVWNFEDLETAGDKLRILARVIDLIEGVIPGTCPQPGGCAECPSPRGCQELREGIGLERTDS